MTGFEYSLLAGINIACRLPHRILQRRSIVLANMYGQPRTMSTASDDYKRFCLRYIFLVLHDFMVSCAHFMIFIVRSLTQHLPETWLRLHLWRATLDCEACDTHELKLRGNPTAPADRSRLRAGRHARPPAHAWRSFPTASWAGRRGIPGSAGP